MSSNISSVTPFFFPSNYSPFFSTHIYIYLRPSSVNMSKKRPREKEARATTMTGGAREPPRDEEQDDGGTAAAWRIVTECPDIFETHIVTKLNGNDAKFFYDVNRESRRAMQRSKVRLPGAFKIGDFDTKSTLSWALEKCSEYQKARFCARMAENGNLELLQFLRGKGCPWDEETCSYAALNGHFECLKYAHENGCPWDEKTFRNAAENGHLECLKYARENGCSWGGLRRWHDDTCSKAALNGHLECLKYAHENGCPWNEDTCSKAAKNGHGFR